MKMASKWSHNNTDPKRLTKDDKEYGTPVPGSKTEARGILAHQRISKEIWELCCVIEEHGITRKDPKSKSKRRKPNDDTSEDYLENHPVTADKEDENHSISKIEFGKLFKIYTYISNKLVGILLRARKYGLVDFEGECLFQRQDDDVIITLLYPSSKVKKMLDSRTFTWGKCM